MDFLQTLESRFHNEADRGKLRDELSAHINDLLLHQFDQLVQALYRIDVSEKKLKEVLRQHPHEDAGNLIADLIIKRQEEKLAIKQSFPPAENLSDDERW
ncbi:MAG: hypothetical protein EON98_11150 [Chitinophagaceae bacterium]|nr:MAG: hypothetical protein EON98_11150 [Chitinophagaceae bacterium]